MSEIPKELEGDDWQEAFAYAGEGPDERGYGVYGIPCVQPALPDLDVPLTHFSRGDVAEVVQAIEGENDGPSWICYGRLRDGRWFCLEAGCDYTGWDCQAGGTATVGVSREQIERFGLTDDARKRFGIVLAARAQEAPDHE